MECRNTLQIETILYSNWFPMHSLEKTQTNNKIFKINMNPNQMRQFSTLVINEVVTQWEPLSLAELIFPWQTLKSRTILT